MKINKLLPIIIMLLLSMTLASCVGIGDGALIGGDSSFGTEEKTVIEENTVTEESTGAEDKMEEGTVTYETQLVSVGDETFFAYVVEPAVDVPYLNAVMKCTFSMCSSTGDERANLGFEGGEAYSLFRKVFHSQRERISESHDKNHNYIDIDFYYDNDGDILRQGKFRIYSNDFVDVIEDGISTMVSSRILSGYTEGIYQSIVTYASECIKPDSGAMITVAPEPQDHVLSVDDAAEVYKLLLTSERLTYEKEVIPSTSMETIQIFFKTDYGMAVFYVNKDDAVGYYEGFLEGENHRFYKIEGIYEKLMDYIK